MLHSLRYDFGPHYYVAARISDLRKIRMYEFGVSAQGEEVVLDAGISPISVSTGVLLEAVSIPDEVIRIPDDDWE